jgi:hypothetical protein
MNQFKYYCEKCNYGTDIKNSMNLHYKSTLHLTGEAGKRNIKTDDEKKIYKCTECDFESKNKKKISASQLHRVNCQIKKC